MTIKQLEKEVKKLLTSERFFMRCHLFKFVLSMGVERRKIVIVKKQES